MNEWYTVEQAKRHARIDHAFEDDDIRAKLMQAQVQIAELLKGNRLVDAEAWQAEVDSWDDESVPAGIQAALYMQFMALYRFRGDDDMKSDVFDQDGFGKGVKGMLRRRYDPALA